MRRELGFADEDIVIGFCGTFGGWHGVEVLAAGLPKICALSPRVKFLLIGDGNLKHLVNKVIADHGLEGQVVDVGLVPQFKGARHMGAADILAATHAQNIDGQTFFGSPTKLFEYMAAGRPVVASRLGQIGRVVEDGASGLLVTPGNSEEFQTAVERLSRDEKLRDRMGGIARQTAISEYTWKANVRRALNGILELPRTSDHG